jgi:hypothetical protein
MSFTPIVSPSLSFVSLKIINPFARGRGTPEVTLQGAFHRLLRGRHFGRVAALHDEPLAGTVPHFSPALIARAASAPRATILTVVFPAIKTSYALAVEQSAAFAFLLIE